MTFTKALWVGNDKLKKKPLCQDIIHFENAMHNVLHERTNITASFTDCLKVQEKVTFSHAP